LLSTFFMDVSLSLARFVGPIILVLGFGLLIYPKRYEQIDREFLASVSLTCLVGILLLLLGLAILLIHNVWVLDWPVFITLLGWVSAVTGVILLLHPETVHHWYNALCHKKHNTMIYKGTGVLFILVGGYISHLIYLA